MGRRTQSSGVVVFIPAWNEEEQLPLALQSLADSTVTPDRVIVVCNNCTDDTYAIASAMAEELDLNIEVYNLPKNPDLKAGALNYALDVLMCDGGGRIPPSVKYILTMDADTIFHDQFIERSRRVMGKNEVIGGLSATCLGKPIEGGTPFEKFWLFVQKVEYGRIAHSRVRSSIHSLSGAGSFYRAEAVQDVLDSFTKAWQRQPGYEGEWWRLFQKTGGKFFVASSKVEDFTTTLLLKAAKWQVTSNGNCIAYTDLMSNFRALAGQRLRWNVGTVQELWRFGVRKYTWFSVLMLILILAAAAYMCVWLSQGVYGAIQAGNFSPEPIWFVWIGGWMIYQTLMVRRLGRKAMLFEFALIPQLILSLIRGSWMWWALWKAPFDARRRKRRQVSVESAWT